MSTPDTLSGSKEGLCISLYIIIKGEKCVACVGPSFSGDRADYASGGVRFAPFGSDPPTGNRKVKIKSNTLYIKK